MADYTQQDVQNLIQQTGLDPSQVSQFAFGNPNFSGGWANQGPAGVLGANYNEQYKDIQGHMLTDPAMQMAMQNAKQNSLVQNALAPLQQYFKMLTSPIDPNDPTWGPYIKAVTASAKSNAGTSAVNSGIQGGLADQGTQAATLGALTNLQGQRMGLAAQVGPSQFQGQLGASEFAQQGLYNQIAQQQAQNAANNPFNVIGSIFGAAGNLAGGVGSLAKGFGVGGGSAGGAGLGAAVAGV